MMRVQGTACFLKQPSFSMNKCIYFLTLSSLADRAKVTVFKSPFLQIFFLFSQILSNTHQLKSVFESMPCKQTFQLAILQNNIKKTFESNAFYELPSYQVSFSHTFRHQAAHTGKESGQENLEHRPQKSAAYWLSPHR